MRLYFPILLGSILTNSEQLWFPKHIVQCSTSHVGSTLRQVSHIRPSARISVHAWHSFCETARRSEEHTSELQSRLHLVCRLLLEKKKQHEPARCSTDPSTRNA